MSTNIDNIMFYDIKPDERLFTVTKSYLNHEMERGAKQAGVKKIRVHDIRHMYATILVEQKVPLIKISALLGHASVNTTFEYYCEVMDENEQIITFMNHTFVPEGSVATC